MELESYGVLCVEGGDQVGKGDATSRILNELESEHVNITYSSFPVYATPVGTVIRSLLKNGCPEEVLSAESNLDVRMALFALNRMEFMDVYLSNEKYWDTLLVLDRSPYSNAVTIGYGISLQSDWNREQVQEYIDKAMNYDSLMISKLGLDRCVVQLKSQEDEWKNIRGEGTDQYEKKDVQERCSEVYSMYKDIVGSGWNDVVTKSNDGWRSRDEIWSDIDKILWDTYGAMGEIRQGDRYDIGFKEIVEGMYPKAVYDKKSYSIYNKGLKGNVKELMYSEGLKLGEQVANSCINIRFKSPLVRDEFRRVVLEVPEVMNVFAYFLGGSFVDKLKRGLEL